MKRLVVFALATVVAFPLCGCGNKPPTREESVPFETAIAAYLSQRSMGMRISEFQSLEIDGDAAVGVVAMQHAEAIHSMKVIWEFTFQKEGDEWTVVSHRTAQ